MRIGLLTSLGVTLDAFFPEIVSRWEASGAVVMTAAGTASRTFTHQQIIPGLTRRPRLTNVTTIRALARWTRENDLQLVVCNTATASTLARMAHPTQIVYFCHGLHWDTPTLRNAPPRAVESLLLRRTDGVITINRDDQRWFTDRFGGPRLHLEYGVGLDLERYPRSPRPADHSLLWAGSFDRRKDPLSAVRVLHALRQQTGADYHLTMAGDGPLRSDAQCLAEDLQLLPHVTFPGHTSIPPLLESASAVLHTARWEGLPRILLEAAAAGRPAFAFDVKGVRDAPQVRLSRELKPEALADLIHREIDATHISESWEPDPLNYRHAADQILSFLHEVDMPRRETSRTRTD